MSVTWFTGQSGSGKTTAARAFQNTYGGVLLDGDEMRAVWPGLGFSRADRETQNLRVARLARNLRDQGLDVIIATICPYQALRDECDRIVGGAEWVYLEGGREPSEEYPYEPQAVHA